jgi:hypothetical protein
MGYSDQVFRFRWGMLALGFCSFVGAGIYGMGAFGAFKGGGFVDEDAESTHVNGWYKETLKSHDPDVIVLLESRDFPVTDNRFRAEYLQIKARLEQLPVYGWIRG